MSFKDLLISIYLQLWAYKHWLPLGLGVFVVVVFNMGGCWGIKLILILCEMFYQLSYIPAQVSLPSIGLYGEKNTENYEKG